MVVRSNDITLEHLSKILSQITYFYLKHGDDLHVKISGGRCFSQGQNQGGMELKNC